MGILQDAWALAGGFATTLRYVFKKPTTIQYPEERPDHGSRLKGVHYLARATDGKELCVGCSLCAVACPTDAIIVVPDETTEANAVNTTERHAQIYDIDMYRCIYCGFCVLACPEDAIRMTRNYDFSLYSRAGMVFTKEMLVENGHQTEENPSAWIYDYNHKWGPIEDREAEDFANPKSH